MITRMKESSLVRVTLTLDRADVDLLDRLATLEGLNRSAELRGILAQFRPMLRATVEAFEAAVASKMQLEHAAATASVQGLEALMPEVDKIQNAYLGALARIEGAAAAEMVKADSDPRRSNHGGHTPSDISPLSTDDDASDN